MTKKQIFIWTLIGLKLLALACATSWIDDASGARTLARGAIAFIVLIYARGLWIEIPTISRKQARINKIQRVHARRRTGGGVVA